MLILCQLGVLVFLLRFLKPYCLGTWVAWLVEQLPSARVTVLESRDPAPVRGGPRSVGSASPRLLGARPLSENKTGTRPAPSEPRSRPVGLPARVEAHSTETAEKATEEKQEGAQNKQPGATQSQLLRGEQLGEHKAFVAPDADTLLSRLKTQGGISCSLL